MRIVRSAAPVRVCDNGGWTDTWFAERGRVFSIAVRPRVEVTLRLREPGRGRYAVAVENYGDRFEWQVGGAGPGRHPLIEAVLASGGLPADRDGDLAIRCDVPAGASTGTSAAVAVALCGAVARAAGHVLPAHDAAVRAHDLETRRSGRESGVQDHFAAAYGGINLIEIDRYPAARVRRLPIAAATRAGLERRLIFVYLGRAHESSDVHRTVIEGLRDAGPAAPPLESLRRAAGAAAAAVVAGDLDALGRAMRDNTDAQADLHPALVGPDARRVIDIAAACGAAGWKVNGAGGAGGSVTILGADADAARQACVRAILDADTAFRHIPIQLDDDGLSVQDSRDGDG
jgi:D-glycero-alpha-D-manno-heptose-7-phosphate kinase